MLRESADVEWARSLDAKAKLQEFESQRALFDAVRHGDIVMALQGEVPARMHLHEHAPGLVRWLDVFLAERGIEYTAEEIVRHRGNWSFGAGR